MDKNQDYYRKLHTFLHHHGITNAKLFEVVKFCGGTQEGGFIGWIAYLIIENKLSVIILPYKRKETQNETPNDEGYYETLLREAHEEVGIIPKTEMLWNAFKRTAESFEKEGETHLQSFEASYVFEGELKYLRSFPGYNRTDDEKGRPIVARLEDAYLFLPNAHLDAAKHMILTLRENIDNPLYIRGTFEKQSLLAHLTELHEKLSGELRQRLRRQTVTLVEA